MNQLVASSTHAVAHQEWTEEQKQLIKSTICPGLSDDEMALFLYTATRTGLDPLAKQIYGLRRRTKNSRGEWEERLSIQVGIDGFRTVAQRSGEMDGREGPFWCGEDGVWRDVWTDKAPPRAAKVVVYRKGHAHGYTAVALYDEYVQLYKGTPTRMWADKPALMLAKCAESLALRQAFPAELSGVYTDDEMAQANNAAPEALQEPPQTASQPAGARSASQAPSRPAQAQSAPSGSAGDANPYGAAYMEAKYDGKVPCTHCGQRTKKGNPIAYIAKPDFDFANLAGVNPDYAYVAHRDCFVNFVAQLDNDPERGNDVSSQEDDDLPF